VHKVLEVCVVKVFVYQIESFGNAKVGFMGDKVAVGPQESEGGSAVLTKVITIEFDLGFGWGSCRQQVLLPEVAIQQAGQYWFQIDRVIVPHNVQARILCNGDGSFLNLMYMKSIDVLG